jgi:succinyl-CoA synthetase beta subunit
MKIHEYQAKALLAARGIAVPQGRLATSAPRPRPPSPPSSRPPACRSSSSRRRSTPGAAARAGSGSIPTSAASRWCSTAVAGDVAAAEARVRELAERMLGSTLVTVQTGPEGKVVQRLYVEQGVDIARELYVSVVLDRSVGRNVVMASTEGGTEIEEVAAATPEKILREDRRPRRRADRLPGRRLAFALGLQGDAFAPNGVAFLIALERAAVELDTDMVEVNPLVVTRAGEVVALDAKVSIDQNALYRHPTS